MELKIVALVCWSILGAINLIARRPTKLDYFCPWIVCMGICILEFFE